MVILFAMFLKDLALSVLADKHSIGNSPESGLHIYFSASFHLEFNANPSGDKHSQVLYAAFLCNAAPKIENIGKKNVTLVSLTGKITRGRCKFKTPFILTRNLVWMSN